MRSLKTQISLTTAWSESLLSAWRHINKTCLYNFYSLKLHFYIVKLGFTGIYIIFLISAQKIDCGYLLEPPRRGGSNEYLQCMFWAETWKISEFLSESFHFLVVKFSVYLNRHVFVMLCTQLAFYVNLHRAVIGPSAILTGRWRPDIDLRRMLIGHLKTLCISGYPNEPSEYFN